MRRSIFLGVFALLFAVGTAFATTTKVVNPVYYWDNEITKENCLQLDETFDCDPGPQTCKDETPLGQRDLYGSSDCESITLMRNQGF